MIVKAVEIRDRATFIAAIAIKTIAANPGQRYLLARCGYPINGSGIIVVHLAGHEATSCAYLWDDRTMRVAHRWIEQHFNDIVDGEVVDVEFILGETTIRKDSEKFIGVLDDI